jgi:hypothetical protein
MRCLFVDGRRQRKQPVHQIGSRPVLCYNLACLVHAMAELGIEPSFLGKVAA